LGLSPYVDFNIALIGLNQLFENRHPGVLDHGDQGVFQISLWKIGPTEIRAIAILANIGIYFMPNFNLPAPLERYTYYDVVIVGVTLLLVVFFAGRLTAPAPSFQRRLITPRTPRAEGGPQNCQARAQGRGQTAAAARKQHRTARGLESSAVE